MILVRKLLIPILVLFFIMFTGLLAFIYFSYDSYNNAREKQELQSLNAAFSSELKNLRDQVLILASDAANDQAIQEAFAMHDREQLIALTQPSFEQLKQYDIDQVQFNLLPATSFLRLHDLDNYGDNLSSYRPTVVIANMQKIVVSGLESGQDSLAMRSVAPVYYQGKHIGSVEFGISLGKSFLEHLKVNYGGEWRILLTSNETLLPFASTGENPFSNESAIYASTLDGKTSVIDKIVDDHTYAILSAPIYNYSNKIIGVIEINQDRTAIVKSERNRLLLSELAGTITLLLAGIGLAFFTNRTLKPIQTLTNAAAKVTSGDFSQDVDVQSNDEIGILANTFNRMTSQLRDFIGSLEQRVQDRTAELEKASAYNKRRAKQFEAIAQVARTVASIQDLDLLLPRITQVISQQFGFYHVGIFLLDDSREFAILMAANSEGGKRMLAREHKLRVGQTGIVGYATGTGNPRIALNTGTDMVFFNNPDLPNTRSEVALPLQAGDQIIGALDVQSTEPNAFESEDLEVLSTLADQVSIAIQNARSFRETYKLLTEAQGTVSGYITEAWKILQPTSLASGYQKIGTTVQPLEKPLEGEHIRQAIEQGKTTVSSSKLAIPIRLRGQVIGIMNLQVSEGHGWIADEVDIAEAVAERLSLAIETATLLQATQHRADIERVTADISGKISSSTHFETILQTAAQELSRALGGSDVLVQIEPISMKMSSSS